MNRAARIAALVLMAAVAGLALLHARRAARTGRPANAGWASAAHWPVYRGDRSLAGCTDEALPAKLKLLWRFGTDEAVTSSVVAAGQRAYFGCDDGNVYAVDLPGGKLAWKFATDGAVTAPPLIVKDAVVVGSADTFLYCLSAADGQLRWKYETGGQINGSANWLDAAAPATAPADEAAAQPGSAPADGEGIRIVAGSYDSVMHCVDFATGQGLWTFEAGSNINGGPAIARHAGRQIIVFGSCDGVLYVLADDGSAIHRIDTGRQLPASPALAGKLAFAGNYANQLVCADVEAGAILWTYAAGDAMVSSPAVSADAVLIGSEDRRLHCVSRDDGGLRWSFKTGGYVMSSPLICGGRVVFGSDDGRVYLLAMPDGKEMWSFKLGGQVRSSPALAGGLLLIGCEDGLYAFGPSEISDAGQAAAGTR